MKAVVKDNEKESERETVKFNESIVIDKINKEFDLHYNELTRDKLNAYKRLTIVKERIEKERQETILKMIDTLLIALQIS